MDTELEKILYEYADSFYESTQLPLTITDAGGNYMKSFGGPCQYCNQFRALPGNDALCDGRHLHGCREAAAQNRGYIFSCPGGLILFAVALKKDNRTVYNILGGPALLEFPQIAMVDNLLAQLALPVSGRTALYSALKSVTLLEPKRLTSMSRLLHNLVSHLPEMEAEILQKRQEHKEQNDRIEKYLSAIQAPPPSGTDLSKVRDLEDYLVAAVQAGNKADAKLAMEQLFSIRSISSGMQTKLTTIHAIELLTLLSRTAIEAGAAVHDMYKMTDTAFVRLMEARSMNQVSYLLEQSVDYAINKIDFQNVPENTALMRQGIYYIRQHYKDALSLEDVAKEVSLSPSYFSVLFKEKTGVSFTAYVNNLKVESAKSMLSESDMSLADIAQVLGFCSQSYFSSVFKKAVGVSPKQYRTHPAPVAEKA